MRFRDRVPGLIVALLSFLALGCASSKVTPRELTSPAAGTEGVSASPAPTVATPAGTPTPRTLRLVLYLPTRAVPHRSFRIFLHNYGERAVTIPFPFADFIHIRLRKGDLVRDCPKVAPPKERRSVVMPPGKRLAAKYPIHDLCPPRGDSDFVATVHVRFPEPSVLPGVFAGTLTAADRKTFVALEPFSLGSPFPKPDGHDPSEEEEHHYDEKLSEPPTPPPPAPPATLRVEAGLSADRVRPGAPLRLHVTVTNTGTYEAWMVTGVDEAVELSVVRESDAAGGAGATPCRKPPARGPAKAHGMKPGESRTAVFLVHKHCDLRRPGTYILRPRVSFGRLHPEPKAMADPYFPVSAAVGTFDGPALKVTVGPSAP